MTAMFTPHFNAWRFYDDDGGEAASTQLEAQDTNHSFNVDSDNALQLRCRVDETGGADGSTMDDYQLQYEKNNGGTFVDLTTTDGGDGIRAVAAGLTNTDPTTNRSSDPISDPGSGSFVAGEQCADGLCLDIQLTASNFTEHVWGVEFVSANVANNDTFDFRIRPPNAMVQNVEPRVTVVKTSAALAGHGPLLSRSRNRLVNVIARIWGWFTDGLVHTRNKPLMAS